MIVAGLEFNAQFLNGAKVPSWFCGGKLTGVSDGGTWLKEIVAGYRSRKSARFSRAVVRNDEQPEWKEAPDLRAA